MKKRTECSAELSGDDFDDQNPDPDMGNADAEPEEEVGGVQRRQQAPSGVRKHLMRRVKCCIEHSLHASGCDDTG